MNALISALIDKKAIGNDNVITASYTVVEYGGKQSRRVGDFGIVDISKSGEHVNLTLKHIIDKNQIVVNDDQILAIDGMDISRYADVYDINKDGTTKKLGKKRGRKPKSPQKTG